MPNIRFKLIDRDGQPLVAKNLLGRIGYAEFYRGRLKEDDEAIIAIGNLLGEVEEANDESGYDERELLLVRSLLVAWLTNSSRMLTQAISEFVPLPRSVNMLRQVGFLDRTVNLAGIASELGSLALSVFLFDFWAGFDNEDGSPVAAGIAIANGVEIGGMLASSVLPKTIDAKFGLPGTPVTRAQFEPDLIFELARLFRLRSLLAKLDFEEETAVGLMHLLDRRLFGLFLINSRQLEGLVLSGAAESTAAVAAHAAIALTISPMKNGPQMLQNWERAIAQNSGDPRAEEATKTLQSIRGNLVNEPLEIERQIHRSLASAATAESIGFATAPAAMTFQLMAAISNQMGKLTPEGHFRSVFEFATKGMDGARNLSEATPDAIASTINRGIDAEAWFRKQIGRIWPQNKTVNKNTATEKRTD